MLTIDANQTLTTKEALLLAAIATGMDQPGTGWLHEVSPFKNKHEGAGVLGALIAKGLVDSQEDNEGPMACWWVELTTAGKARALLPTDGDTIKPRTRANALRVRAKCWSGYGVTNELAHVDLDGSVRLYDGVACIWTTFHALTPEVVARIRVRYAALGKP